MALCEYGEKVFKYKAAPFGVPKIPGIYQTVNAVPVNIFRQEEHQVYLYLDDRLFLIQPKSLSEEQAIRRGDTVPEGLFKEMLLMTAAGTYINRAKSVLKLTSLMEFLGFLLNTKKCTIKIPEEKWNKFVHEAASIKKKRNPRIKELEKLRGKMCSFLLVATNMRLYIRRVTAAVWINAHYIARERSWLEKEDASVETRVYTDASNFACGIYSRVPFIGSYLGDEDLQILPIIGKFLVELG
jgi:hypothetical protein